MTNKEVKITKVYNAQIADDAMQGEHEKGWTSTLKKLEQFLNG